MVGKGAGVKGLCVAVRREKAHRQCAKTLNNEIEVKMYSVARLKINRAYRNIKVSKNRVVKSKACRDKRIFNAVKPSYPDIYWKKALHPSNDLYGIEKCLRDYSGFGGSIFVPAEHGVYFGPYVSKDEANPDNFPLVITFGQQRAQHLAKQAQMPSLQLGPYIYYASEYMTQSERNEIKKKVGKTLLVFPAHSIESTNTEFDLETLFEKIEVIEKENNIDTTLFCLYFNDIEKGKARVFYEREKMVVCAGHRFDPFFLSRLKSLILLSDLTVSNEVGTHIGYCEVLGKPHHLIEMNVQSSIEPIMAEYGEKFQVMKNKELNEVREAFSSDDVFLKKNVLEKYWGINKLKSRHEMNILLKEAEFAYYEMLKTGDSAVDVLSKKCGGLVEAGVLGCFSS